MSDLLIGIVIMVSTILFLQWLFNVEISGGYPIFVPGKPTTFIWIPKINEKEKENNNDKHI